MPVTYFITITGPNVKIATFPPKSKAKHTKTKLPSKSKPLERTHKTKIKKKKKKNGPEQLTWTAPALILTTIAIAVETTAFLRKPKAHQWLHKTPQTTKKKISLEALIHNHTTPNNREGGGQRYDEIEEVGGGKAGLGGVAHGREEGAVGRVWVGSGTLYTRKMKAFFGGEGGRGERGGRGEVGGGGWWGGGGRRRHRRRRRQGFSPYNTLCVLYYLDGLLTEKCLD